MGNRGTAINGKPIGGIAYNGTTISGLFHGGQVIYEDNSDGYVHDGLVARYIASRNVRDGYDPTSLIWRDLVGNADLTLNPASLTSARRWGPTYFESLKQGVTWYTMFTTLPAWFSVEDFTVEYVFMPTDNGGSGGGDVWAFNGSGTAPYVTADNEVYSNNLRFYAPETATYSTTGTNQVLTMGRLYGVSCLIQPYANKTGRKQLYIGGTCKIDIARSAANLYVQGSPTRLNILGNGGDFPTADQVFYGRLYELRVYGRALSAAEIAQNYARDAAIYGIT